MSTVEQGQSAVPARSPGRPNRNPAARRRRQVRSLTYLAAVLLSLFVLVPIYLVTVTAFTPQEVSYDFPKPLVPGTVSAETVRFFAGSTGVLPVSSLLPITWPPRTPPPAKVAKRHRA